VRSFFAASLANADTINFTVTITRQQARHTVPFGTVYSGFIRDDDRPHFDSEMWAVRNQ
jgi:hypothetical protein